MEKKLSGLRFADDVALTAEDVKKYRTSVKHHD